MQISHHNAAEKLRAPIDRPDVNNLSIFKDDPLLLEYKEWFHKKLNKFQHILDEIEAKEGSLYDFASSYKKMGFNETESGVWYREWAPGAKALYLIGDFNNWDRKQHPLKKDESGVWEIFIPKNKDDSYPIPHLSKVKVHLLNANNEWVDKIPAWITFAGQSPFNVTFDGIYINQQEDYRYKWKHPNPSSIRAPKIYEAHVGMSSVEPRVATYREFTQKVLPRIKALGYNAIQLMAIMEHSYYGSFGYHVTNFFAISSRSGTINELKELIDTAHSLGLYVLLDIIHSHSSSNAYDGLNYFDGTSSQYFYEGEKGYHSAWDSMIFDYSKWEVIRFLLSNLCWYLEEYRFDGFRFDGVTSMMYEHHGIGAFFTGEYYKYFEEGTDMDAIVYLMLANTLIHRIRPNAITIAEDVSGMPGVCWPVEGGGCGFDYRMSMAIPDKWILLVKELKDEEWMMEEIVSTLTNRRRKEKCIAYVESHDQAIVGDKTQAMWLFGEEIYTNMSVLKEESIVVHRGMALHKMMRLITIALGGEGYLNFMGNEFGHPEWIDFPRDGNGYSHQYCRRQWNLADDHLLYFNLLQAFDREMIHLEEDYKWLSSTEEFISVQKDNKVISFAKGGLLWIFNFHPVKSFEGYNIGTNWPYDHIIIFDTDEARFGGKERVRHGHDHPFPIHKKPWDDRTNYIKLYLPSRCAIILKPLFKEQH